MHALTQNDSKNNTQDFYSLGRIYPFVVVVLSNVDSGGTLLSLICKVLLFSNFTIGSLLRRETFCKVVV